MLWTTKDDPKWTSDDTHTYTLMNIPLYSAMSNCTMDDIAYDTLMIEMNDPNDHNAIDNIVNAIEDLPISGFSIEVAYEDTTDTSQI